jgi:CheY-like chemotaxis protein
MTSVAQHTPRILICDDEPTVRELIRVALVGEYEFAEAASTTEAIRNAGQFQPDLVLLDVMMPGGSGLDVLRRIRRDPALRNARVLVISAVVGPTERRAAESAGADGFIEKPFDPDELSDVVSRLLVRG